MQWYDPFVFAFEFLYALLTTQPIIGLSVLGLIIFRILTRRRRKRKYKHIDKSQLHYSLKPSLLTDTELHFYQSLVSVVDHQKFVLNSKVRLADIFEAKNNRFSLFVRISQKHVDFLVCDRKTLRPLLGIELDDKSHNRADRRERDKFVDSVFKRSGLPILHVKVRSQYNRNALSEKLMSILLPPSPVSEFDE